MSKATYKVRVESRTNCLFSIVDVDADNKSDAERLAKAEFKNISGVPAEKSRIGYVWIPKEHQYPNNKL